MRAESALRVLHIDDDEAVGREVRELLELRNIDCESAMDLNEARKMLARDPDRHIVLVDFHLPGISGAEIIEILQRDIDRNLAFIVLTGDDTQETAVDSLRANAFDFLRKPVDARKLVQTIQRANDQLQQEASPGSSEDKARRHLDQLPELADKLRWSEGALRQCLAESETLHTEGDTERAFKSLTGLVNQVRSTLDDGAKTGNVESLETSIADARELLGALAAVFGNDAVDGSLLHMRPFDLTNLLNRLAPSIEQLAGKQDIRFRMLLPRSLTYVLGDESVLGRAFAEIILAIVGTMNAGEEVLLAPVREGSGITLVLKADSAGRQAQIPDALLPDVAPELYRGGKLDADAAKLTVCRLLIGLHGGHISEDTALGGQPRLRLYLPLAATREANAPEPARASAR